MLASMIFRKEPFFHGHDNYDQVRAGHVRSLFSSHSEDFLLTLVSRDPKKNLNITLMAFMLSLKPCAFPFFFFFNHARLSNTVNRNSFVILCIFELLGMYLVKVITLLLLRLVCSGAQNVIPEVMLCGKPLPYPSSKSYVRAHSCLQATLDYQALTEWEHISDAHSYTRGSWSHEMTPCLLAETSFKLLREYAAASLC